MKRRLIQNGAVSVDLIEDGEGPAIAVLPSGNRGSEDMDGFAQALARRGYHVLRPQPRGFGQSSGPLDTMSLADLAADVAFAVKAAGHERAVVLGHAYGNWIARMTAAAHPALVRGVVLAAASALKPPEEIARCYREATDTSLPRATRLAALQKGFFAPGRDASIMLAGFAPHLRAAYDAANARVPRDVWWPAGSAPILDLQGALDPWRPEDSRSEIRDALGDRVTAQVLPGLSHAFMLEDPEPVAEAVHKWIGTLK